MTDKDIPGVSAVVVIEARRADSLVQTIWLRTRPDKIGFFLVSIFLFILAITLMKEGAKALTPLVRDSFQVNTPANGLGFGWLFAYVIMSGSPVAASAPTSKSGGPAFYWTIWPNRSSPRSTVPCCLCVNGQLFFTSFIKMSKL